MKREHTHISRILCSILGMILCTLLTVDTTYAWLETSTLVSENQLNVGSVEFFLSEEENIPSRVELEEYDYSFPAGEYTVTLKNKGTVEGWCIVTLTELDVEEADTTAFYSGIRMPDEELTLALKLESNTGITIVSDWYEPEDAEVKNLILLTTGSEIAFGEAESWWITFDAGEGSGEMEPVKEKTEQYVLPKCGFTPPAGKVFRAWQIGEAEFAQEETIEITNPIVVTALWGSETPEETGVYTVTFVNGDLEQQSLTTVNGKISTFPEDPIRDDVVFAGWFTEPEGGELVDGNYQFTKDTTVYARWTAIEKAPEQSAAPEMTTPETTAPETEPAETTPQKTETSETKPAETAQQEITHPETAPPETNAPETTAPAAEQEVATAADTQVDEASE